MRIKLSFIAIGMMWLTLPLLAGLGYWEHNLTMPASGHTLVQLLLLPLIFSWVFFWNTQAEISRLRDLTNHHPNLP